MSADSSQDLVVSLAAHSYRVRMASGDAALRAWVDGLVGDRPWHAVIDAGVHAAMPRMAAALTADGAFPLSVVPAGEAAKTFSELDRVCRALADPARALPRDGVIVAAGGGATCDLAGLAASLYLRGVDVLHVPTTLLAMLDAAVGGKTAINLAPLGKNLVGTFHQPLGVFVDVALLDTLPAREYTAALGEVAKYAALDADLLRELLEPVADGADLTRAAALAGRHPAAIAATVLRCLAIKADVVVADERERAQTRETLNLGHTLGHALETATALAGAHDSQHALLHGEAVALGLHFALALAECASKAQLSVNADAIRRTLDTFALSPARLAPRLRRVELTAESLRPLLASDKKRRGDVATAGSRWVLPLGVQSIPRASRTDGEPSDENARELRAVTYVEGEPPLSDVDVGVEVDRWLAELRSPNR